MSEFQSNSPFPTSNFNPLVRYGYLPVFPTMSPQTSRLLWFFLEGGPKPYSIDNISISTNVDLLKAVVQLRLNETVPIDPDDSLAQRLEALGDIDAYSRKLSSGERVRELFPEPHSEDNLHIIVQCPGEYCWLIVPYEQN
ncbi:hypothetical protein L208DRAFT_1412889 [Tricholoma matsutake]|nr:hypothetical protein L208DRAFT_1412889 [Tricholoma matsutake 945]